MVRHESGLGDIGGGAGKGGGWGGSIKTSGGAFGKRQAALEEEYFYKLKKKQLADLRKAIDEAEEKLNELEQRKGQQQKKGSEE